MFDPVEKLKEYVRQGSVSADPQFQAGMVGAQQFLSDLLTEIGFNCAGHIGVLQLAG